jgi:hypothetical protein
MTQDLECTAQRDSACVARGRGACGQPAAVVAMRPQLLLRCWILLLLIGGLAAATEPPPSLLGEWVLAGTINLDTKAVTPAVDQLRVDLRRDVVVATNKGVHQALYCTWSMDEQGIELQLGQGNGSVQHAPLLVMADGIVLRFGEARDCMFMKRADGKPPGLPPSPWPVAQAAPATAPADPKALAAGDFTVRALQLQMDRMVHYPESSKDVVSGSESVRLAILIRSKVTATIAAARCTSIAEATTDTGEDMRPQATLESFTDPAGTAGQVIGEGDIWLHLALHPSSSSAKELAHFRATAVVSYEGRRRASFDLPLPRTLIGKRQLIADTGLGLTITSITADTVAWTADEGLTPVIKEIQFLDRSGKKIENVGSSSVGDGNKKTVDQSFTVQLPEEGAIRLRLFGTLVEVTVPIVLERLALVPPPPPQDPIHKF